MKVWGASLFFALARLGLVTVVYGEASALPAGTSTSPSASSTYLKAHGDAASSKYFGDRMWTNQKVDMVDQNEFWTLFMIPVTVSAMVLCITAYGMMGIVIVWTQRDIMVTLASWMQGSMTRLFCKYCCCCCCCCRCCRCRCRATRTQRDRTAQTFYAAGASQQPPASPTSRSDVGRIVEERAIAQVEQVVRCLPWIIVCALVTVSVVVFGLAKWLPTILMLNYLIGNAMYVVAKVQITSAQCTGLGIAEGLLLIYLSLGRSVVKALFLFPRPSLCRRPRNIISCVLLHA